MEEELREYEDNEEELRQAVEEGRMQKIAGEVLCRYFDERKEEIVRKLESEYFNAGDTQIVNLLAELRVMKGYKDMARKMITLGEIAEERLREIGS